MDLRKKRVLVVGLGKTGFAAACLLASRGALVTASDIRPEGELTYAAQARALGVTVEAGRHELASFVEADLIVLSPGVPEIEPLLRATEAGVPIVSEIELASWYLEAPAVAITGTNGKSTVTTLVGEMCRAAGREVFVGGNLGSPLVEAVGTAAAGAAGMLVVELSSFQLERTERFHPHVAALLNLSPDHLDRYPSFEAYRQAKARIFACQDRNDFAIVPDGDVALKELAASGAARLETFGQPSGSVRVNEGALIDTVSGMSVETGDMRIRGEHNLDNACAAALCARLAGIDSAAIKEALVSFAGLPHRMQFVREFRGVSYYNDSKATNVGAAVASIRGLSLADGRVVLIAGGKHKGGSYAPLRQALDPHGRALILVGEAADLLAQEFGETALIIRRAASVEEAVTIAAALAESGDAVLLAPACSSYDMFSSYTERGDAFERAVTGLRGEA